MSHGTNKVAIIVAMKWNVQKWWEDSECNCNQHEMKTELSLIYYVSMLSELFMWTRKTSRTWIMTETNSFLDSLLLLNRSVHCSWYERV